MSMPLRLRAYHKGFAGRSSVHGRTTIITTYNDTTMRLINNTPAPWLGTYLDSSGQRIGGEPWEDGIWKNMIPTKIFEHQYLHFRSFQCIFIHLERFQWWFHVGFPGVRVSQSLSKVKPLQSRTLKHLPMERWIWAFYQNIDTETISNNMNDRFRLLN